MNKYTIDGYTRISKARARKMFNNGDPVYMCPVNLRPGRPWYPEICFYKTGENFEKSVFAFEFYNCINNETGKYTAFYIREEA
jgi:hypothetical protein